MTLQLNKYIIIIIIIRIIVIIYNNNNKIIMKTIMIMKIIMIKIDCLTEPYLDTFKTYMGDAI